MTLHRQLARKSQALALEPRILLDAALVTTAMEVSAQEVAATDTAPGLSATPVNSTLVIRDSSDSFPAIDLFKDVTLTGETVGSDGFQTLVISVDSTGSNQALLIDGSAISLTATDAVGVTANNQYRYSVTVTDTSTTITLSINSSDSGNSAAALQSLIDNLAYQPLDNGLPSGSVNITLHSLSDTGGQVADLNISARVTLDNQTSAAAPLPEAAAVQALSSPFDPLHSPTLDADTGSLVYADLIEMLSDDGSNQLEGIRDVVSVGDQVYILRSATIWTWNPDTNTGDDVEVATLYTYQRAEDGSLTWRSSLQADANNGLSGALELGMSRDGNSLYALTPTGVALFSRDASSGSLTAQGQVNTDLSGITQLQLNGNLLYVSQGETLNVFQRSNGTWQLLDTETAATDAVFTALQVSNDGRYLFAGTSGGATLVSVFAIQNDGSLSRLGEVSGTADEAYTQALTLAPDGKTLYAAGNGSLQALAVAENGSLSLIGEAIALDTTLKDFLVSADGRALIVVSDTQVALYTIAADGSLSSTPPTLLSGIGDMQNDADNYMGFNELRSATLSADGSQLYLSWQDRLLVLDLQPASVIYREESPAVVLLPGGTLSDPQLDALSNGAGNYQGASIVISREGGANAEDQFSLVSSDDLRLEGQQILLNGVLVGSFVQSAGSLTLSFTATISQADAQRVLRSITYRNSSDDPQASANLTLLLNDGDGNSSSLNLSVALENVNDAPQLTSTTLTPTFTAQGEAVALFSDTRIDTIEAEQGIWQVVLTVDSDGSNEVLIVAGEQIALGAATNGIVRTASGLEYRVSKTAGTTTVQLYVGRTGAATAALIDSLAYLNTGTTLSGTRQVSVHVIELGDWQQGNDTSATLLSRISLATPPSPNSAPEISGASDLSYTENSAPVTLLGAVTVSDSQMDALNAGQGNYSGAIVSLTLGAGYSSSDVLGFSSGNGYSLSGSNIQKDGATIATWRVNGATLTLTFSAASGRIPTTADVNAVLQRITYQNRSDTPVARVAVSLSITDQAGATSAVAELAVQVQAINDAPVLGPAPALSQGELSQLGSLDDIQGLNEALYVSTTGDGQRVYIADATGAIALFNRDPQSGELSYVTTFAGAGAIKQLAVSADGSSLYAIPANGNGVIHFAADAQGNLSHVSTLTAGIWNMRDLAIAEDGRNLYLIDLYGITVFNRDTSSGALTRVGELPRGQNTVPYLWAPAEIVSRGDYVYVITNTSNGSTLIVYQRDSAGWLTAISNSRSDTAISLQYTQHISVSADGLTIFVANSRTSSTNAWTGQTTVSNHAERVDGFRLDPLTGKLSHMITITGSATVEDLAVTADGAAVLVTLADGSLHYYAAADGSLVSSHSLADTSKISLNEDGEVIVLGDTISLLSIAERSTPTLYVGGNSAVLIASNLAFSDPELDALGNYQGASLTFSSDTSASPLFGFANNDSYRLVGSTVQKDGQPVATLQNGVLTFTAPLSKAEAQAILRQITYQESGAVSAGSRTITLVLNDGSADSATQQIDVLFINANLPPAVNANALNPSYSASAAETPLFTEVTVSSGSDAAAQNLIALHLDISGVGSQGQEWLRVAGTPILLSAGNAGELDNGLHYSVTASDSGLRLTLSSANGISAQAMQTLIAGIRYGSDGFASAGVRSVSLSHLQDNGGTDGGGNNSANPGIVSRISVSALNHAPQNALENFSLGALTSNQAINLQLPASLFHDPDGDSLSWSVSGLPTWLSFDAQSLTLSGTAPDASGNFTLTLTARDAQGASASRSLTLQIIPPASGSNGAAPVVLSERPGSLFERAQGFAETALQAPLFGQEASALLSSTVLPSTAAALPATPDSAPATRGFGHLGATLSQQLANTQALTTATDASASDSASRFTFDGTRLSVAAPPADAASNVTLRLPSEMPGGGAIQQITLANGLPLPSWARFDARTGELRIDADRLQQASVLRLTLLGRDSEGQPQRLPLEIRASDSANPPERRDTAQPPREPQPTSRPSASLAERLRQEAPSALLSQALQLLEQLSEPAHPPADLSTRPTA